VVWGRFDGAAKSEGAADEEKQQTALAVCVLCSG